MEIISNGSHFYGEKEDTVDDLIQVLKTEVLNPLFSDYGNFFYLSECGDFRAFGNFLTISHVFNITGTLEELYPLAKAIKEARRRPEYLRAKAMKKI